MGFKKILLILSVLLFIAWVSGDVTSCYECRHCKLGEHGTQKKCLVKSDFCYKIQNINDGLWEKGCGKGDGPKLCEQSKQRQESKICLTCTGNDCNSSSSVVASLILSMAALVFLKMN